MIPFIYNMNFCLRLGILFRKPLTISESKTRRPWRTSNMNSDYIWIVCFPASILFVSLEDCHHHIFNLLPCASFQLQSLFIFRFSSHLGLLQFVSCKLQWTYTFILLHKQFIIFSSHVTILLHDSIHSTHVHSTSTLWFRHDGLLFRSAKEVEYVI